MSQFEIFVPQTCLPAGRDTKFTKKNLLWLSVFAGN